MDTYKHKYMDKEAHSTDWEHGSNLTSTDWLYFIYIFHWFVLFFLCCHSLHMNSVLLFLQFHVLYSLLHILVHILVYFTFYLPSNTENTYGPSLGAERSRKALFFFLFGTCSPHFHDSHLYVEHYTPALHNRFIRPGQIFHIW